MTPNPVDDAKSNKHVVAIGLGNIGSPLVDLLARTDQISHLTLIDRDIYEASNLRNQAIQEADIGRPKAVVQAERVRKVRPAVRVEPIWAAVEDVPLSQLRSDVVVTGLDSKLSRQQVNERVWRLGIPWIDGGVETEGWLARMSVYVPGSDQPCLECAWDEKDYQTLEVRRPCQEGDGPAPKGAPAFLGGLAAALLSAECVKVLSGDWGSVRAGTQVTLAVGVHQAIEMRFRRNARCRFDHNICDGIHPMPRDPTAVSLGEFIEDLRKELTLNEPITLRVEAKHFDRQLRCACGEERVVFCLEGRMPDSERVCASCGGNMSSLGFSQISALGERTLTAADRDRSLASVGLRTGDTIMVKSAAGLKAVELVAVQSLEVA